MQARPRSSGGPQRAADAPCASGARLERPRPRLAPSRRRPERSPCMLPVWPYFLRGATCAPEGLGNAHVRLRQRTGRTAAAVECGSTALPRLSAPLAHAIRHAATVSDRGKPALLERARERRSCAPCWSHAGPTRPSDQSDHPHVQASPLRTLSSGLRAGQVWELRRRLGAQAASENKLGAAVGSRCNAASAGERALQTSSRPALHVDILPRPVAQAH